MSEHCGPCGTADREIAALKAEIERRKQAAAEVADLRVQLTEAQSEIERLKDELAHAQFARDADLNAFMRLCIDKLGMETPREFTYAEGFDFVTSEIADLKQELQIEQIVACHDAGDEIEAAHQENERLKAEIERLKSPLISATFICGWERSALRLPPTVDKRNPRDVLEFVTRSSYPTAPDPLAAVACTAASMIQTMHDELHAAVDRIREADAEIEFLKRQLSGARS